MASKIFGAIATTGGTDGSLDSILEATLSDGDLAIVGDNSEEAYVYRYESSSTAAESDPEAVRPDDYGSSGVWILLDISAQDLKIYGNAVIDGTLTVTGAFAQNDSVTIADGKYIIWDNAPASDDTCSGEVTVYTAGENLVYGDMCYYKSDGKLWKADADASTTMPVVAMAAATINADATGNFLLRGFVRDDTLNLTVPGLIYASTTAGGQTQTRVSGTGDQLQVIGRAEHADRFYFNPELTIVEIK
jgi:hypothetical protein